MFITPAYAQAAGAPGGVGELVGLVFPFILIMGVFYFLVIGPQRKKLKEQQEIIGKVTRGDTVVTTGGLIGRVVKVDEGELLVEVGENVKVRVLRQAVTDVRAKGEPAKPEAKPAKK
jgi:preprotein translocase subunit YajC